MVKIKSLSYAELEKFAESIGEKKFRAKQIFEWMHRGVRSFDEMTNLSKELREKLKASADLEALEIETLQISKKDGTRKYLFRLSDGQFIESVLMKYSYGNTVCISSQVGCKMGCAFCASCLEGLVRSLTSGEMLDQVLAVSRDIGEKIGNVVVMGIGEPFDNYKSLTGFIDNINNKNGINLSARSITVSTCGLVPEIERFAKDYPQVTLAISLHAPNEALRNQLMPVNKKYDYRSLLDACKNYVRVTNKRITFEYILIEGLNDSTKQAKELADSLRGILCHINLIPFNGVIGKEYKATSQKKAQEFKEALTQVGFEATVRRELGSDIDGACGQLRTKRSKSWQSDGQLD